MMKLLSVRTFAILSTLLALKNKLYVSEYIYNDEVVHKKSSLAYTGMFMATKSFIVKSAEKTLSWHRVEKNGSIHFEKFIFDAFPNALKFNVLEKPREEVFAPIKTLEDLDNFAEQFAIN